VVLLLLMMMMMMLLSCRWLSWRLRSPESFNRFLHACKLMQIECGSPAAAAAAASASVQMAQLEAEVAAKQQQLQQLSAENVSLTAKARVLDQLVASAGRWGPLRSLRWLLLLLLPF
jgi:hypothetical protein